MDLGLWTVVIKFISVLKLLSAYILNACEDKRYVRFLVWEAVIDTSLIVGFFLLEHFHFRWEPSTGRLLMFVMNAWLLFLLDGFALWVIVLSLIVGTLLILFVGGYLSLILWCLILMWYFWAKERRDFVSAAIGSVYAVNLIRLLWYALNLDWKMVAYTFDLVWQYGVYVGIIFHCARKHQSAKKENSLQRPKTAEIIYPPWIEELSERELEVLCWLSAGLKSEEIAECMYISKRTVDYYRSELKRKLKCNSVAELIRLTVENRDVLLRRLNKIDSSGSKNGISNGIGKTTR